jgi:hypothetical protein
MKFNHYVITQFNVLVDRKKKRGDNTFPKSNEWCLERFRILKTIPYKSISKQENKNFKWLVFFDYDSTPSQIKKELKNLPHILPIYVYNKEPFNHKIHINKFLIDNNMLNDWIITTMLDADDALNVNYIDYVQNMFLNNHLGKDEYYIEFQHGLRYHVNEKIFWKVLWPENPFMSVVEKVKIPLNLKTCKYDYLHYIIARKLTKKNRQAIGSDYRYWLHIAHNFNVGSQMNFKGAVQIQDSKYKRSNIKNCYIMENFGVDLEVLNEN